MDELEHLKGKLEMRSKENTFSNVCTNYNTILRVTERPMDIGVVEYTINKVEYPILAIDSWKKRRDVRRP